MEYIEREEEGYLRRDGNKGKGMEEREAEKGGKDRVGYGVNAIRNIHTFSISHARPDFSSDRESIGHVRSFSVEIKYGAISR